MLCLWRRNVKLSVEEREKERRAECHYRQSLLSKALLAWYQRTALAVSHRHQQEEALRDAQLHMDRLRMQTVLGRWREQHGEVRDERLSMEKACRHHHYVVLRKSLRAWIISNQQHKRYQLQSRRTEAQLTEMALWNWSLNLQAKVLYAWRHWVDERHRKQRRLVAAAQFYRDGLLREGVTHILTYTAHMSAFSSSMALRSHEHSSRQLQAVVRRCALRWKQRALCKTSRVRQMANKKSEPPKKSVSFCLPEDQNSSFTHHPAKRHTAEHSAADSIMDKLLLVRASRLQPRRPDDLLNSPAKELLQHPQPSRCWSVQTLNTDQTEPVSVALPVPACLPVAPAHPSDTLPPAQPSSPLPPVVHRPAPARIPAAPLSTVCQDVLLPPSSFTVSKRECKTKQTGSRNKNALLLTPHYFAHNNPSDQGLNKSGSLDEEHEEKEDGLLTQSALDPTEALTEELLEIKLDLQRYQQDRNQLLTWRKLQKVMTNWLQTTGSDAETEERESIIQELHELESRISALSVKLTERKPTMICHAARVQSIESQLLGSSFPT